MGQRQEIHEPPKSMCLLGVNVIWGWKVESIALMRYSEVKFPLLMSLSRRHLDFY